jgi:hypothetical protein
VYAKIGEGGVSDHGELTGLGDNDHPQYSLTTHDHDSDYSALGHNHDGDYLGITAKAADSDKLDGIDSSAFGRPVFLTTPLTSTSWDGDSRSTTAKTLIDLSAVFGVPAGVKAVLVQLICKDSGSAASNDIYFGVSPNGSSGSVTVISVGRGLPNDTLTYSQGICPCDSNGDIYYQIVASGSNTMDCYLRIWGYWL